MRKLLLTLGLALAAGNPSIAQSAGPNPAPGESRLLRHPSYSKGRVAFSYLGDIWIASETGTDARRLTDHTARDIYPRFSPRVFSLAATSSSRRPWKCCARK